MKNNKNVFFFYTQQCILRQKPKVKKNILGGVFSWEVKGTLLKNSCKPPLDLQEASPYRSSSQRVLSYRLSSYYFYSSILIPLIS